MYSDLKRILAALLVLVMLLFMITASASQAGTSGDPLISRSYLDGRFKTSLQTDINKTLADATDAAISRLDELFGDRAGYSFAPRFIPVSLLSGGSVSLTTGASFILLSGSAALTVSGGTVINVSTGNEVPTGSLIALNERYFCAENTRAEITVRSAAVGLVEGSYFTDGSVTMPQPLPFGDVAIGAWFYHAVLFVYSNELFSGTTATTFAPNTSMTRGMFVTVLHRLDGRPEASVGDGFTDIGNPAAFYFDAVAWANENGIVRGYADGTFQPNRSVTREEMAVIMMRYATYKGRSTSVSGNALDTFSDSSDVSTFAVSSMQWAVSLEIIRGSGGRLLPGNTATRAEVAQIILNYCDKVGR